MANPRRGEVAAILDGRSYKLCLTLGGLAELETAFGDESMLALAQRFESGRLSARDCIRIIAAGLRGAGHDIADDDVARMQAEAGVSGFVDLVSRLLRATFAAEAPSPNPHTNAPAPKRRDDHASEAEAGPRADRPFHGTTS